MRTVDAIFHKKPADRIGGDELAAQIERRVKTEAGGRIHGLSVLCLGERIVLRGRCRTHYAKQLALAVALSFLEGHQHLSIEIAVE